MGVWGGGVGSELIKVNQHILSLGPAETVLKCYKILHNPYIAFSISYLPVYD